PPARRKIIGGLKILVVGVVGAARPAEPRVVDVLRRHRTPGHRGESQQIPGGGHGAEAQHESHQSEYDLERNNIARPERRAWHSALGPLCRCYLVTGRRADLDQVGPWFPGKAAAGRYGPTGISMRLSPVITRTLRSTSDERVGGSAPR